MVKRITLVGVQFTLVHMKDGGIRLGAEGDKSGDDVLARLNDVINAKGSTHLVAGKLRGARCQLACSTRSPAST